MRYAYKAHSADGRLIEGQLDGDDASDIIKQLAQRGAVPVSLSKLDSGNFNLFGPALSSQCLTNLLAELAVMLRSGLPLDEALSMACLGLPPPAAAIVKTVRDSLIAGMSITQALERHPRVFPADLIAMTRVGEATGDLHLVFASLAQERERAHTLAEKVRNAISYPIFLIVSALGVLLFFLLHVIPQFSSLFQDPSTNPGPLVIFLLNASQWLLTHELELALAIVAAAGGAILLWRNEASRLAIASALLKLPIVSPIWSSWRTSRFLASLSLLLAQGVGADAALKILQDSIGGEAKLPLKAACDEVRRGARLSEALSRTRLFDTFVERMLRIGEETGEMSRLASEAAALYARNLEKRLDTATAIIGPAAILIIAVLIGGLMAIIMSALMSVNQAVL